MRIGILGGTGFTTLQHEAARAAPLERVSVESAYGARTISVAHEPGVTLFFLNRHGDDHAVPAHRIDHRANIDALARCRVDAALSLLNTGALRPGLASGDVVVPHDLVDLTGATPSLFDDEAVHVDLSEPYCPHARDALLHAASAASLEGRVHARGVYVATRGPRLETPAEVAHLARLGDVVGMTGAPEAILAREAGLCHAALAFVANPAAGLAHRLEARAIRTALAARADSLAQVLVRAAQRFPGRRDCVCREAPQAGRLAAAADSSG